MKKLGGRGAELLSILKSKEGGKATYEQLMIDMDLPSPHLQGIIRPLIDRGIVRRIYFNQIKRKGIEVI